MKIDYSKGFTMVLMESTLDCSDFRPLFEQLPGDFLVNPGKWQLREMIKTHLDRPLIICGHGTPQGVINKDWNGYVLDSNDVQVLRQLPCVIGVWCFASEFADKYDLKGFFTSMFISTPQEAAMEGFVHADPDAISAENVLFSVRINSLIKTQPDVSDWVPRLQRLITRGQNDPIPPADFVKFNYEALSYFE